MLGKDGTPWDQARYEKWVYGRNNSSIKLEKLKPGVKGGLKWDCPKHGLVRNGAIAKHKRECQ